MEKLNENHNRCTPKFSVEFAAPEHGWIDTTFRFDDKMIEYPFSSVYDPFYKDITEWLETICDVGQATMRVDIENDIIDFLIEPALEENKCIFTCRKAYFPEKVGFSAVIPLNDFISTFYATLIEFWESKTLRERWDEHWESDELYRHEGPDAHELGPWSLRSARIEDFITKNAFKHHSPAKI